MKRLIIILSILFITSAFAQNKKEAKVSTKVPNGYENMTWGIKLSKARDSIKGKLFFTDEKTIIISKEGELEYHYGFFYIDPAAVKSESEKDDKKKEEIDEGKLFYVSLKFPYLTFDEVKKKIEDKYGPSTNENISKNQGAVAWNGEKTIIVMWVDRYEKKPYCRRITYISKEIAKELNEYQVKVFNETELDIIKKLNP